MLVLTQGLRWCTLIVMVLYGHAYLHAASRLRLSDGLRYLNYCYRQLCAVRSYSFCFTLCVRSGLVTSPRGHNHSVCEIYAKV